MRGEAREGLKGELPEDALSVEKQQEQLLMNKLAANGRLPAKPATSFLQKRLQQRKFFDSGDYAMDKNKAKAENKPIPPPVEVKVDTKSVPQETVPKPEADKIDVPKTPGAPLSPTAVSPCTEEALQIPTPETVPQRKASIIFPSVHSKLSPQPHIHHETPESH
uniref:cAMP-regulated phosphoprotein 19 n=1 Tax=Steinernema glaseri TaxID=37863 RepID=A0A1I7Y6N4_9BILA